MVKSVGIIKAKTPLIVKAHSWWVGGWCSLLKVFRWDPAYKECGALEGRGDLAQVHGVCTKSKKQLKLGLSVTLRIVCVIINQLNFVRNILWMEYCLQNILCSKRSA